MDGRPEFTGVGRRRVLGASAAFAAAALAGCTGDGSDRDPESSPPSDVVPTTGSAGSGTAEQEDTDVGETGPDETAIDGTEATTDAELDLREANVVGVELQPRDGAHRFSVTLYHDDDGEDGYADWWQVETLEGERLGRRELLHAHGTAPFTRSETIDVPDDVGCVVVRGHDQTHGHGGRAMLVEVESGEGTALRQGPDRRVMEPGDCP